MINLIVDNREIEAVPGQSLLQVCLNNGIYIPHLCFMENDPEPDASCRLCFVEIDGAPAPVTACTLPATEGMNVRTDTPRVRRLQRSALRLLLSVHMVDCRHCHANRACALQDIAVFLNTGLKSKPLESMAQMCAVDRSHPFIDMYPHRCVLCGKCLKTCRDATGRPDLTLAGRGMQTRIRHFPADDVPPIDCTTCGRCIDICPVGALQFRATLGSGPAC